MNARDCRSEAERSTRLFQSDLLTIGLFDLGPAHRSWRQVNVIPEGRAHITFNLVPTRIRFAGHDTITPNPSQVVLYNADHEYTRQHLGERGSACVWIELSTGLVESMRARCGRLSSHDPTRPFAEVQLPCAASTYHATRALLARLTSHTPPDPIDAEEAAMAILVDVLSGAAERSCPPARPDTARAHARIVSDAIDYMLDAYAQRLRLADIAHAAHTSAFHLSRVFRGRTSMSVFEVLERIRIARALDGVVERRGALGQLAREVGFVDQAHLTNVFRKRLGVSPGLLSRSGARRPASD